MHIVGKDSPDCSKDGYSALESWNVKIFEESFVQNESL